MEGAGRTAGELIPGDDASVPEWLRATVTTAFHPACSRAMGGTEEAVCDAAIAIAERAADLLRG